MIALPAWRMAASSADGWVEVGFSPSLMGLALLALAAACFGAFTAASLLVYSPAKLQMRLPSGLRERVTSELDARDPEYQIVARLWALVGLIGAFLAIQAAVTGEAAVWAFAAFAAAGLLACGVLPAAVAEARAESVLLFGLPVLRASWILLRWPLVVPIRALTSGVLRALRIREDPATDRGEIAEEVMAAVSDTVANEDLADEERLWIGNIIEMKDRHVSQIMTPRTDMVCMQKDMPLREAVALALREGFSRFPVYAETLDDVVGVFYVKDALRLAQKPEHGPATDPSAAVSTMMREPCFVPETMDVPQLLRRFKTDRLHVAIVLDEYGGTAGMVSIEDILEEIVGDIEDEYDEDAGESDEERVDILEEGRIIEVPGRTAVDDVNEMLDLHLPEDGDYDTIAGFVISHQNRIPEPGEVIEISGVTFEVLAADDRRITRVRITAPERAPAERHG
ncbi:MAG: hypothetical protein Fur0037_14250 [Planctomycetota bacterium]